MECSKCGCTKFKKTEQKTTRDGYTKYRNRCTKCGKSNTVILKPKETNRKYVITSCQNDTDINENFFDSIKLYAELNECELIVLPTRTYTAKNITEDPVWNIDKHYMKFDSFDLQDQIRILASISISNTAANPLIGIDNLSLGKHLIFGNNQLQMKTLVTDTIEKPIFAYTTGTISKPVYSNTRTGYKAELNHTYSFLFVEITNNECFIRDVVSDESGCFYDITGYYTPGEFFPLKGVSAVVLGDEHVIKIDSNVSAATSDMINELKPEYIVRHDVLDFYSGSHHHNNNFLLKYKKHVDNSDNIEDELYKTCDYIENTTPDFSKSLIVESNHCDHLEKWLNSFDFRNDPKNSKLFFSLMYEMVTAIEQKIEISPFEAYCKLNGYNFQFVKRNSNFEIAGVDISYHGDKGSNGSRGNLSQFAKTHKKYVIGHSHSPRIERGCYQVGTSTGRLEYAVGLTSWANSHCVIYPNGKCQLVTIFNGSWR
jgi:hypothetical protein